MSTALEILSELHRRGVSVRADGDELVLKPRRGLDAELLSRIREHKPEIVRIVVNRETTWPPESEAQAQRFGQSHARLFPFIDKRVWTPKGTGRLFTAFAEDCEVILDGTDKVTRVRTEDVRPLAGTPQRRRCRNGSR